MLKVMTIVGTRPELIKMSRVIAAFDAHTRHVLVHTGQNYDYELNQVFFDNVRVPVANRLGEENDGWSVAKYLLTYERGGRYAPGLFAALARLNHQRRVLPNSQPLAVSPGEDSLGGGVAGASHGL